MLDLFVLRHGEAGKRSSVSRNDSKRALTEAGKKEIVEIANAIKRLDVKFDFVYTSPLIRAKQTADILADKVKNKRKIEIINDLKPEGDRLALYSMLSKLKQDSTVLLVGHEPYLSKIITEAITDGNDCRIDLKKAGFARVRIISFLPKIQGELRLLLTPKLLKLMS